MPRDTVHVLALFTAAPGREDELQRTLTELIEPTRKEAGCIRYDLIRGLGSSAEFAFIEEWESAETLDAHSQSRHLQEISPRIGPLLGTPAKVTRYTQVG